MPPEIADSDAESDIVAPDEAVAEELPSPPATRPSGSAAYNATQRLSQLNSSANGGSGSTDLLMKDVHRSGYDGTRDDQPEMVNTGDKRRRAQSEGLATVVAPAEEPKSKRPKTYGTKRRNSDLDLFGAGPLEMERQMTEQGHEAQDVTEEELPSLPSNESTSPTHIQRERDRPRRVVSLLQQTMTNPDHRVTTATSSMGGYQSINLDFRGGIDMHTNPFGSISQVSVDNAASADVVPRSHDDRLNDMIEQFAGPDIQSQMTTSPVREGTPLPPPVEPLSQADAQDTIPGGTAALEEQDPPIARPSKRQRTDAAASDLTTIAPPTAQAPSDSIEPNSSKVPDAPQAKKRGRPKSKKKTDDVDELAEEEPKRTSMGPPPVEEQQITARSRANTAEPSSQASQSSQPASNTKKKRQRNKTGERREEELKKLPSSELNLSDEQLIGLPKENYKPRPSRSRSKRVDAPADTSTPLKDREDSAVPSQSTTPASKPSTGKNKKSKVKRAKTAAGALLKGSAPMISDGEEDVVWMESKPAAVKLNLPPSLDSLKQEPPDDKQELSEDELQQPEFSGRKGPGPVVSVEVPLIRDEGEAQSDGASDKKTKKKRGRPKKSAPEVQTAPTDDRPEAEATEAESRESNKENERPALAAKDPNTSIPTAKEKAKAKGKGKGNAKSKLTITDSDDEDEGDAAQDQENLLPTPSKPSTPADKEKSPSAPTDLTPTKPSTTTPDKKPTHSPLKPTPLSADSAAPTRHRIGLSKRSKIPSLLRKVDRAKPPPTKTSVKVTELKIKGVNVDDGNGDVEADGESKPWTGVLRDKDGRLVEWDF